MWQWIPFRTTWSTNAFSVWLVCVSHISPHTHPCIRCIQTGCNAISLQQVNLPLITVVIYSYNKLIWFEIPVAWNHLHTLPLATFRNVGSQHLPSGVCTFQQTAQQCMAPAQPYLAYCRSCPWLTIPSPLQNLQQSPFMSVKYRHSKYMISGSLLFLYVTVIN